MNIPHFPKFSFLALLVAMGCSSPESFVQPATTLVYKQDYNPPLLDVVWVVDSRSPMYRVRDHLIPEVQAFFQRLDGLPTDYRMVFTNVDKGILEPNVVLTKGVGTLEQRVAAFGNSIGQIINLKTGATNQGFYSALTATTHSFQPRAGVPLVFIFLSDGDDHSTAPAGQDAVSYFANQYLALKGNRADLLRVYSLNYLPVPAPQLNDTNRCATRYNADIDKAGFEDRYFRLANALGGTTGDLCGSFGGAIDLTGLRLKTLPKEFPLSKTPDPATLLVTVEVPGGQTVSIPWQYDAAENKIVFDTVPPEGSVIRVTFRTR